MAITSNYELVFILKVTLGEEATAAAVEKFRSLIAANGTIEAVDEWGRRRLAYPIDDENEGYYVQITFVADNAFPSELDRQLKITDGVLRSLIIHRDEKEVEKAKKAAAAAKAAAEAAKAAAETARAAAEAAKAAALAEEAAKAAEPAAPAESPAETPAAE